MGLWYPKDSGFKLTIFSDVDPAILDTRKSTSEGKQFLGDKLVSWMSKKHDYTSMSSAEAEYLALSASFSHSNLMQPRAALPYQAHPYSIPLYQGTCRTCELSSGVLGEWSRNEENIQIDDLKHFTMTNENPSRVNLKQLCGRSVLTEPEVFATKIRQMTKPYSSISAAYHKHSNADQGRRSSGSKLSTWGRGKAVYISPPPLPRGRRDWIPLSLSMFCFDEFLVRVVWRLNIYCYFRKEHHDLSIKRGTRYASLLIMFCYLTVCGTFLIVSNGLALHDIALLLAIANGQSIAISNSDDTCAVCR
ncbi:hypothetical protein Tco_0621027 [Tanacetum coccineum]